MTDGTYAWVKLAFEVNPAQSRCPHGDPSIVESVEVQVRETVGDRYRSYEALCDHTGDKTMFEVIVHLAGIEPPALLKALHDIDTKLRRYVAGAMGPLQLYPSQWNVGDTAIVPDNWNKIA